jgi:signal transduction histidine kinase
MDEEEVKKSLDTIKDASNNLMLLLENLLTWAKLQKNEIENYPEKFAINYLVKKYVDHYRVKAEQKHIDLVYTNGEEVFAYADPNLVSIVVKNLISNSIKYSDKNSKVVVNIENINNKATMNITDKGIGIDKDTLKNIFSIHNDKDSRFGTEGERGTGIGLILSKSFVDMNNGDIWIESEEGKGTTVTFELPSTN